MEAGAIAEAKRRVSRRGEGTGRDDTAHAAPRSGGGQLRTWLSGTSSPLSGQFHALYGLPARTAHHATTGARG